MAPNTPTKEERMTRKQRIEREVTRMAQAYFEMMGHNEIGDLLWDLAEEETEDGGDIPGIQDAYYELLTKRLELSR